MDGVHRHLHFWYDRLQSFSACVQGDGDYEIVPHLLIDDYLYSRIKKVMDVGWFFLCGNHANGQWL